MPIETWLTFLATVLVMMCTPGPSHFLMLSNSINHGFPRSLATAAGDLSANALQMLAAGLGLASVLLSSATAFTVVKWCGVAYLLWLGINMVRQSGTAPKIAGVSRISSRRLWLQGFVTSAANPKAVIFFAALFPLFIDPALPFWPQLAVLSATYLTIDGLFLCGYGVGAGWLGRKLRGNNRRWLNRVGGGALIIAAVLLGLRTVEPE